MDDRLLLEEAAIAAEEAGDLSTALERWGEAVASFPRAPGFRLRRASVLHDLGLSRQALNDLNEALKFKLPADYRGLALSLAGRCHQALDEDALAEEAFRGSIKANPTPEVWVYLAVHISSPGRRDEAISCLEEALALDPLFEEIHYNLGVEHSFAGRTPQAIHHLEQAIAIDPKYALALAELGFLRLQTPTEALPLLERSALLDPARGWTRLYLAIAYKKLDRLPEAKAQYESALVIWPQDAFCHALYGDFLSAISSDLALGYLRKAILLDPGERQAHYYLGLHWLRRNRRAMARASFEQALRLGDERAKDELAGLARRLSPKIPARLRREAQG